MDLMHSITLRKGALRVSRTLVILREMVFLATLGISKPEGSMKHSSIELMAFNPKNLR